MDLTKSATNVKMMKHPVNEGWVNINGEIFPAAEARISVFDRGFIFGDSIYEVIRTYGGKLFKFDEHYARLCRSAKHLGMDSELVSLPVYDETIRTVRHSGYPESYIRLIVTRGESKIGLQTDLAESPNLVIMVLPLVLVPEEQYQKGIHMAIVSIVRNLVRSLDPNVKTGNYLNNLLAMREAQLKGAQEAAMLNYQGFVTEATTSNIFFVFDGVLVTPPIGVGILEGITRQFIFELAEQHHIPFQVRNISGSDVAGAQECFLSGSIKEILPITCINHKQVGDGIPGPVTKRLSNIFRKAVGQPVRYPDY